VLKYVIYIGQKCIPNDTEKKFEFPIFIAFRRGRQSARNVIHELSKQYNLANINWWNQADLSWFDTFGIGCI